MQENPPIPKSKEKRLIPLGGIYATIFATWQAIAACGSQDTFVIDVSQCDNIVQLCDIKGKPLGKELCLPEGDMPIEGETLKEFEEREGRKEIAFTPIEETDGSKRIDPIDPDSTTFCPQ